MRLRHGYGRRIGAFVLAGAVLATGAIVWQASYAAFSSTAPTQTNSWTAGSVSIANDQAGSAVFALTGLKPDSATSTLSPGSGAYAGSSASSGGSACIKVTYTGSLAANVRLYATLTEHGARGLGRYLLLDIDYGSNSQSNPDKDCATYTKSGNADSFLYGSAANSTAFLASALSANLPTDFAGGLGAWNSVATNDTRWFRISWLLPANTPDDAQDQGVDVVFTWEAHNT